VRPREAGSRTYLHALRVVRRYKAADVTGLTSVTQPRRLGLLSSGEVEPTTTLPGPARLVDDLCACR